MASESKEPNHVAHEDHVAYDPAEAERNLLRAVLMSAMTDIKKSGEAKRQATEFFMSEEDDYLFSFKSICAFLNIDADKIVRVTGVGELIEDLGESEH